MGFNVIEASKKIAYKYHRYLTTMFDIKDKDYKEKFLRKVAETKIFEKGPYLDVTNSFAKGRSIKQLINDGVVSKDFKKIDRLYNIPNLHYHQEEALLKAIDGNNLIVSTGTGSGKTECFLLPLINELMREKEEGTLCDGVRALIIYPMNALANDQIDRLRKTFIDYPDITFGCYTGQTAYQDESFGKSKGGIDQYISLNGNRIDDIRLRKPLKNERLSRASMKERPPHILITNYAMLEYLMLRPEDNVFFNGPTSKFWKYIILDEAHTYTGSTGIEVSMLLRRLKAQLDNENIQFILTSATLGDENSNKDVISFAEKLCSTKFNEENIIRAKRIEFNQEVSKYTLDSDFYSYVDSLIDSNYDDQIIINEIENKYKFGVTANNLNEYLYEILILDDTFWKIKRFVSKPKSIREIREYTRLTEKELSSFVEVASRAMKNNSKLFDSRYHMFLRATEGVFITLAPHKDLFLTRKKEVYDDNNNKYKVFEAVTCTQCHSLYLLGYINKTNSILEQKSSADSDEIKEAFYVGNQVNDTDEDELLIDSNLIVEKYELCPHCGFIRSQSEVVKRKCSHEESHYIKVVKVKTTNDIDGRVTKCISCENVNRLGILRGFFSGQEASTAVIGTALFEELPSHVRVVKSIVNESEEDDGFDIDLEETVEETSIAKQFIAFSDSRQAAAYFSSYFSVSYDGILYGRLIRDELSAANDNQIEMKMFVKNLTGRMRDNNIIPLDDYLNSLKVFSASSFDYEKVAWQAILKELVDNSQRNSLIGLGLLGLNFNNKLKFSANKKYFLSADEVRDICMVFVMGMLADVAMYYPKTLNDADKEFFTHNGVELSYLKDSSSKKTRSFIPKTVAYSNKRLDYLMRVLSVTNDITKEEAKSLLGKFWDYFFINASSDKPKIMFKDSKAHYTVNLENLVLEKNKKWYRCSKCNKITSFNVRDVCPSYKCDGKLEEVNIDELEKDNHYYKMYHELNVRPLRVVEHTAQLNREEAYNYQNLFKDQKIDVLSCSTTFEMGVDVGDLETVFMRNMPPSASNYAQRAGRAGRSSTSAAYALTFCNKSNHDFNYFERPTEMISGTILPPVFKTDNEKICLRHLYSSAFSFFFKIYPSYFSNAKNMMEKDEETGLAGYDVLYDFLNNDSPERDELREYLKKSIPSELQAKFGVDNFGWVSLLFNNNNDEFPSLKNVKEIYLKELNILREEYEKAKSSADASMFNINKRINTYENEVIISFLSKNNILPKYGFPVDTVELTLEDKKYKDNLNGIELSRDLSMAISEYAPGCQVVANNKLVTSRYIKKIPGFELRKYDYIQCDYCKSLNVSPHITIDKGETHPLCKCKQCNKTLSSKMIKTFLIPEFGFVAESEVGKPSLIKPEKTYKTEASFFNYSEHSTEYKYQIANTEVSVSVVGNDGEMAMFNTTDFFVCPHCGYAIESPEGINPFAKTYKEKLIHKNPKGYFCQKDVELERYSLGYKFKTDVVRIRIHEPLLETKNKHDEAYSILQAIILAACKELNIENTEIEGCLQYYYEDGGNYSYILYDKTPGGAGHVKRINNQETILHILINAMNIAQKCPNCDKDASCYSCLRTYYNQRYHDIIKREYVFNYLAQVLNGYSDGEADSKLEEIFLTKLQNIADSWTVTGTDKNIYVASFGGQKWTIEPQVYLDLTKNVISPSKPDFVLTPNDINQKKIAVYTDGFKYHNDIVDKDSIKRDSVIFSGNYRVWSLSWNDVNETSDKVYATEIFSENNLPSKLTNTKYKLNSNNSFLMLIEYLKNPNAEKDFLALANSYFDAMLGRNVSHENVKKELVQINDQIQIFDTSKINILDKYRVSIDSQVSIYLIEDGKRKVVTYIQDYIQKRKENFVYDWNAFLQVNNIMQFIDFFVATTQEGLDNDYYSILSKVEKINYNIDEKWNEILSQILDTNAKMFVKECINRSIVVPTTVGYELDDGSIAELEWDTLDVVYLTEEQLEFKSNFEEKGFDVVTSIAELEKVIQD